MSTAELPRILDTSRLLRFGRYGIWNALEQVANLGLQRLAVFPLLAYYMGTEGFGSFILAFTIVNMIGVTPSNGISGYIIREIGNYATDDRRLLMRTMLMLSTLIVLPMGLILAVMAAQIGRWYGNPVFSLLLPQFAVYLVLSNALETCLTNQRVEREFGYMVLIRFLQGGFLFAAIPLYWRYGSLGVAGAYSLSSALCLAIVVLGDLKTYVARPWFSKRFAREALSVWLPLSASVFLLLSAGYLDRMLLGYWWPTQEVAIFFAAVSTAAIFAIPGSTISGLVLSLLGGVREASRFSRRFLVLYAVGSCAFSLILFLVGEAMGRLILSCLYPQLEDGAVPLWSFAVASFAIMNVQTLVRPFIIRFLSVKIIPLLTVLGVAGRVVPLVLLVPSGGRSGAVTAMLIGSAWSSALWLFVYMRGFGCVGRTELVAGTAAPAPDLRPESPFEETPRGL